MLSKIKNFDSKSRILTAITIGGSLEWYQIGLFIFWPLLIEESIPGFDISIGESTNTAAILLLVILTFTNGAARVFGGWLFGKEGDGKGRLEAFTHTIFFSSFITLTLLGISFIVSYKNWINYYVVIFAVFKFLQGIPAGGELPGAICYLFEASDLGKKQSWQSKRYMCSFALLGPQIGLALSAIVCLILKTTFPLVFLKEHGWRYLFSFSGSLGILGVIIRKKLQETVEYLEFKSHHKVFHKPVKTLFSKYPHRLKLGLAISVFEVIAFSVLSMVPFYYTNPPFNINSKSVIFLSLVFSTTNIILLPTIGYLSSKTKTFPWLKISVWGTIVFSPILLFSLIKGNFILSLTINFFMLYFLSIQAAILPSLLAEIFPVKLRYTGIAFSFNICDAILWNAFTGICFLLLSKGNPAFIMIIPFAAITFLFGIRMSKSFKRVYQKMK